MADAAGAHVGMIAIVGLEEGDVERIRVKASERGSLWVANRNADVQFVLSGEMPAVAASFSSAGRTRAWISGVSLRQPSSARAIRDAT